MFRATLLVCLAGQVLASELGATFGDAAVSQLVRHAAARVLQEPRIAEVRASTFPFISSKPLSGTSHKLQFCASFKQPHG